MLQETFPPEVRKLLPRGYRMDRFTALRVCNVVIMSYNATSDRQLAQRFQRAVSRLRARC